MTVENLVFFLINHIQNMSRYPYIDRNPCILAAGKPIGDPHVFAKDLFQDIKLQDKVDALRRQFGLIETKDYSTEWFKPTETDTSGAFTEIRHCLRRPVPSQFQAIDEEVKNTIYDSYWNKPVGKSRDQTPGLPRGLDPLEVTFGRPTKPSEPGSRVINPPKPAELVQEEDRLYHCLYAFSHQDVYPGEQVNRSYSSAFSKFNSFGKPSKKDESGARVRRCLTWFNNDPISNVSRRLAAVRNRTLPPLGKSLDKTGVTDKFPTDHTFGKPTPADFYGVEDLLNDCPPSLLRRDMLTFFAYANKLRESIHDKINLGEIALEDLYEEISNLNRDNKDDADCTVNYDCIDQIMKRHRIYLDRSKLEPFFVILGLVKEDGKIKIRDFINFIDKNQRFPELKREHYILPPEFRNTSHQSDHEKDKNKLDVRLMPPAGIPTIRQDKAKPIHHDSITNMDHLSQETTARTLISPSIYSQYGLTHRDFFKPRSKEFLNNLFKKINVTLPEEVLDEIYEQGYRMDQTGGVCVETFRNLLDERAYRAFNRLL